MTFKIKFDLKVKFDLKSQIFFSPPLEIHNHHITITEPLVLRAIHRPDFHGLHPLHILIYPDSFTVPTISQSQHVVHTLIQAAEGISAFTVALVNKSNQECTHGVHHCNITCVCQSGMFDHHNGVSTELCSSSCV